MLFLTYEEFSVQTRFTPDQVREILSKQIENNEASLSWTSQETIKADLNFSEEYRFNTISTKYRRHRATIDGKVLFKNGITKIDIIVRPSFSTILIAVLVLGLLSLLTVFLIANWFEEPNIYLSKDTLVIFAVLILGYGLVISAFKFEVAQIKYWLKENFHVDGA